MSSIYNNKQSFNSGIHLNAAQPLDDRLQIGSISDIYISNSEEGINNCAIYGMAYDGMVISVVDPNHDHTKDAILIQLKDATPYAYGEPGLVNENNYTDYWTISGKNNDEYITDVINPSINAIEKYIDSTNIINNGAIGVNASTYVVANGVLGKQYKLSVNVDNSTVKIVSGKVTAGEYSIEKLNNVDSSITLSSYQLKYKAPGASSYTYVGDKIDIPKDFVLEDVHICKAIQSGTTYTETAIQDQVTPEQWEAAQGDVYIHFVWNVKSGDDYKTDSYLKVSDIIGDDIKVLQEDVADLKQNETVINSSINDVLSRLDSLDTSVSGGGHYYDGAMADGTSTLTSHGNLPKGVTVSQLKSMTLSEILTKILFETAVPTKIQSASATIAWVSDSKYKNTVDVGEKWPSTTDMVITYKDEIWNWTSSQDPTIKGTPVHTTGEGVKTYLYNGSSWNENDTLPEGTTESFYGTVASVAGNDAVDSLGSTKDSNNHKYRSGTDAQADNALISTLSSSSSLTVTAGWKYCHNATHYSSVSNAWSNRNTNTTFKGNDVKTQQSYVTGSLTVYLQWPKLTASQHAYVYIPNSYKITDVNGANDTATNTFDVPVGTKVNGVPVSNYGISVDSTVTITNSKNVVGTYKRYEINPMSAITTVQIKIGIDNN